MTGIEPLDVLVSGDDGDTVDDFDQAVMALVENGGWPELKRRGRTFDEYMASQIAGFTPQILIAKTEAAAALIAAGEEALEWDPALHPRDDHGRFGDKGDPGARPRFPGSVHPIVRKLADAKADYCRTHGLPAPREKDFDAITADPARGARIAGDYAALPERDPAALESYRALRDEVGQQFDYLTNELGVNVQFVAHDPYKTAGEMVADVRDNNTLQVLKTATTGPHPFFTNEENDQFRAVHDAFGHAAIGRAFDRNGEEAAYQSHRQMFSEKAIQALATETRGQNSALVYGGTGTFPPQKVALLPPADIAAARVEVSQSDADADNLYDVTRCHHTSLGRSLAR